MKYRQQDFLLKNKETVTLRMCVEADAAAMVATIKEYLKDSPCIPLLPHEFIYTVEEEQQLIRKFTEQENSLFLVAVQAGKIIGNIDVTGNPRSIMKHTAMIGMGMLKVWRGSGLGTLFMEQVLQWAQHNPVLEQLWLEVYAENEAGLQLYRNAGFEEKGRFNAFFKHNDVYSDKIIMGRSVL